MNDPYTEEYFLRGKASGLSLYEDYRWLKDLTVPMAQYMAHHLGIQFNDTILDFGCARGYLVRAFRELDFDNTFGFDVSDWALKNCDPTLQGCGVLMSALDPDMRFDWVIAKDVLEHLSYNDLRDALAKFSRMTLKGALIVVPLSNHLGAPYVVADYEKDVTHKIRWPLRQWADFVQEGFGDGWSVCSQWRLPGVKDNYRQFARGNGFLTVRRVVEPSVQG